MRFAVLLVVALAGLLHSAAHAQGSAAAGASLDQVERQVEAHRYAEARQALSRWWAAAGDTATAERRAHALYLRAVLGEDMAAAEQDLLRIAVEHPQSSFADRALFRLAQARLARDDSTGAAAFLERLLGDHPQSAHRAEASRLLGRRDAAAPRAVAPPPARPAATPSAPARPAAPPARAPADGRAGPAALPSEVPGATYTVQVGAFARVADAEAMRARLRQAGFDAFLARVGGTNDTLVRVGAYRERGAAQALQQRLRSAGHPGEIMAITGG